MTKFHKDGSSPDDGCSIFVFGSNLSGIHGAGAAYVAVTNYGAKWGCGVGLCGQSYAVPTKSAAITTLPINTIRLFVGQFVEFTKENPEMHFFVTRVGCGLAGYEDAQIAPLFRGAVNCSFAEEWKPFIEGTKDDKESKTENSYIEKEEPDSPGYGS